MLRSSLARASDDADVKRKIPARDLRGSGPAVWPDPIFWVFKTTEKWIFSF
jgi:hypothetical protein